MKSCWLMSWAAWPRIRGKRWEACQWKYNNIINLTPIKGETHLQDKISKGLGWGLEGWDQWRLFGLGLGHDHWWLDLWRPNCSSLSGGNRLFTMSMCSLVKCSMSRTRADTMPWLAWWPEQVLMAWPWSGGSTREVGVCDLAPRSWLTVQAVHS